MTTLKKPNEHHIKKLVFKVLFGNLVIMRITIIILSIFLIACNTEEKVDPPTKVSDKFKSDYPNATNTEWEKEDENYEVDFSDGDEKRSATYSNDGDMLEKELVIRAEDLPETAGAFIMNQYGDVVIKEIEFVERGENKYFEVEFENEGEVVELYFDRQGIPVDPDLEKLDAKTSAIFGQ